MAQDKDVMEFEKKLFKKLETTVSGIKEIKQKQKGYNFEYVPIESVIKAINPVAKKNKLFISTSPNWIYDLEKEAGVPHPIKEGKEFFVSGIVTYSITDLETGFSKNYYKLAAGKGADPGQAVGAAETYSLRQWMNKTFSVEVEREEINVAESIYVFDRHGDSCVAIESDQIGQIINAIVTKTGKPDLISDDVASILHKYNQHYKTNYKKLKNEFPSSEFEELLTYTLATLNKGA